MKKSSNLQRFLINYFKIFLAILVMILIFVYLYLLDYQNNLPTQAGNQVIKAIETLDMNTLDKLSSNLPKSLTDPKIFTQYLYVFGEDLKLMFYPGTSKVENQSVLLIANNNKVIATLTIEKTGKKSFFGFEKTKVIDLIFKPLHTYTIISPKWA